LGWLKVVFAALVAVDVALIAWLAQTFRVLRTFLVIWRWFAVCSLLEQLLASTTQPYRRISELENL